MIRFATPLLLSSCLISSVALAQTAQPTAPNNTRVSSAAVSAANKQWEYLVVSFGKTYFANPNEEPEAKTAGLSKLVSYSKAGIVSAQEALTTQGQMDTLGKFGWELSGLVGSIGGDQQMVFRRTFDPSQSEREAKLIREEGERLLAAQKEASARMVKAAKEPSTELVDLDAVEKAAATAETRRKEESRLKQAIETMKDYPIVDVNVRSLAFEPTDSRLTAEITLDGSAALLKDGNKYRSSEGQAIAKQVANAIYAAAGLKQDYGMSASSGYYLGDVKISVLVKVTYQNASKVVATENVGGKWSERVRK